MNRSRIAVSLAAATALALGALWVTSRGQAPAGAQDRYPAGIDTTLRVTRAVVAPGSEVGLVGGLHNTGATVLEIPITCDPPVDFEITGPDGGLIWKWSSPCTGDDHVLRFEPGVRREWDAVWPGTNQAGEQVPVGTYFVWAIVHTTPREAVAGPLAIRVSNDAPPTEQPHPTDMPHPTATHIAEPTRPHEPDPTATQAHPGVEQSNPFEIADGGTLREPDVAGSPELGDCQNLVVWYDETAHAIRGRFVEGTWRGEVMTISGDAGAAGPPAVAFNGRRHMWLVVWPRTNEGGNTDISGRFVECGNVVRTVFNITDGATNDDQVAVASHGEGYAVLWHRVTDGGASQVHGAAVFEAASQYHVVLEDGGASEPGVACEAAEPCLAVWSAVGEGGQQHNIIGRWWWPREELTGERYLTIAGGEVDQHEPAVAWNGTEGTRAYLVTWTHGGADNGAIYGRGVGVVGDGAGTTRDAYDPLGEAARLNGDGGPAGQSDVGSLGIGFAVVWSDHTHEPAAIKGRFVRVRRDGGPGAIVAVSQPETLDNPRTDTYPAVSASGPAVSLVVWEAAFEGSDATAILGRQTAFPGGTGGDVLRDVELIGRVTAVRAAEAADGQATLSVAVEQVLTGRFSCSNAEVYYDTAMWPGPFEVGDRLRITGAQDETTAPCELAVGEPGTSIQDVDQRRFTPFLQKP